MPSPADPLLAAVTEALAEMLALFDRVENGYCSVCGGYRRWLYGQNWATSTCENKACPSHRWRAALRGAPRGER